MTEDLHQRRLGRRVRDLRRSKQLTQEQLAEAVGRSVATISNIERGLLATRLSTLAALAKALEVEMADFFSLSKDQPGRGKDGDPMLDQLIALIRSQDDRRKRAIFTIVQTIVNLDEDHLAPPKVRRP
jgi:transcriptional regulator with XRE-family HTH domain